MEHVQSTTVECSVALVQCSNLYLAIHTREIGLIATQCLSALQLIRYVNGKNSRVSLEMSRKLWNRAIMLMQQWLGMNCNEAAQQHVKQLVSTTPNDSCKC